MIIYMDLFDRSVYYLTALHAPNCVMSEKMRLSAIEQLPTWTEYCVQDAENQLDLIYVHFSEFLL